MFTLYQEEEEAIMVSWCSWLSRQSNTLKVSGSNPGDAIFVFLNFKHKAEHIIKLPVLKFLTVITEKPNPYFSHKTPIHFSLQCS